MTNTDRDLAPSNGSMPLHELEQLVMDGQHQPEWRLRADMTAAYIDGKQIAPGKRADMEETGQPISVTNLMQRTVNGALGQEAKSRLDWKCTSDNDAFKDVAEIQNERLHEAQRETYSDMAISDAYKSQIGPGIGWVEVSRNPDPLEYRYRVEEVHRNEMWWDWRARRRDLADASWLRRDRWVDRDEAITWFPQHAQELKFICHNGPITDALKLQFAQADTFDRLYETRQTFNVLMEEWLDSARQRVRFYEVWYKRPKIVTALLLPGGERLVFDKLNPMHHELITRGLAQPVKAPSFVIRQAMFAGPYRLLDRETKLRRYPYIPFWCYRDDADRSPYGLGEGMMGPQDEYNERRSKLLWLLKARQVFADSDALDEKFNSLHDLALEALRPDAVFVLNPTRKGQTGVKIQENGQLAKEQVEVMNDAKQLIQDVPGIYSTMLGNAPAGVTSGLAINSLVEQSLVSLGEVNDNYRYARRMVGEALHNLITEDLGAKDLKLRVGSGRKARQVVLNTVNEEGLPINQVKDAPVKVGLQDVPSTPAYRMQQQQTISQALQAVGASPAASALLTSMLIETSDLPDKERHAEWLRRTSGIPEADEADGGELPPQQPDPTVVAKVEESASKAQLNAANAQLAQARTAEIAQRVANPPLEDPAANDAAAFDQLLAEHA